jgi:hypothetical protein
MPKSRSRKYGRSKKSSKNGIRMVTSGVKNVGSTVLNVGKKATPVVEKGVGVIYDTLSSGFNLGVKGIKKGINFVSQKSKKNRSKKSRKNKSRRH